MVPVVPSWRRSDPKVKVSFHKAAKKWSQSQANICEGPLYGIESVESVEIEATTDLCSFGGVFCRAAQGNHKKRFLGL